jgi:hypothetical protein
VVVSFIPTNEVAFEVGNGMRVSKTNLAEYAVAIPQIIPKQVNNIHSGVHDVDILVRTTPACVLKLSQTARMLLKQAPLMES